MGPRVSEDRADPAAGGGRGGEDFGYTQVGDVTSFASDKTNA